jgi:1,4-dihydroxy-2-naphthoyl-CoA synthase
MTRAPRASDGGEGGEPRVALDVTDAGFGTAYLARVVGEKRAPDFARHRARASV